MSKDKSAMKTIISAGAATAFCGALLYAVGQTLSFLFRDVDPDRIAKEQAEEPGVAEAEPDAAEAEDEKE